MNEILLKVVINNHNLIQSVFELNKLLILSYGKNYTST